MRQLLLVLAACGAPDATPRWREAGSPVPRDGGTLRLATSLAVSTLDPAVANDEISIVVLHHVVAGLVDFTADGTDVVPRLAARWTISPDGRRYEFVLRPGLRYGDGTPIVAGDVRRALERVLADPTSVYRARLASIAGAPAMIDGTAAQCTGITVDDAAGTIALQLTEPSPALLTELALPYTAPIHAAQLALPEAERRRRPLASGPFEVTSWDEGRAVELRARPGGGAHLAGLVMLEHVPRDLQFLMFERGELDVIERLAAPDLLWLRQQSAWTPYVRARPLLNAFGSRMNTRVKPFDDVRVRQALNYAVDKSHIVKLLAGTARASHGVLSPGLAGVDPALEPYPRDPARARALLAEAGYPAGFATTYVTFDDEDAAKLAVSLQRDLADVGVTVEIATLTFNAWATAIGRADGPPFSIATYTADAPDPAGMLDPLFHSRAITDDGNASNNTFYASPELDRLLDAAHVGDPAARAAAYRAAERVLHRDAPWIWGYHQLITEVAQPYVRTAGPHPVWVRAYADAWLDVGPDGTRVPW
jgi:ABC-type transport system substrate-binding protein